VDFISHPGKKVCRDNEFYGGGPKWIVTPKCIFDFDPGTLEARLAMTFPGVTVDDVKANTGFEVKTAKKVETVQPPTKEELDALRNEVDKTGVLRH
jgi:glutaconate CoA-transferase subunit B